MSDERRFGQRWPINCPAKIRLKYKNSTKNYEAHINNLSLKGLQIFLKKLLPEPEILKTTIFLPENLTVEARVKVLSCKAVEGGGHLYNLAILGLKNNGRELISQLIDKKHQPDLVKSWWKETK
jgi:hypothetical protein